MSLVGDYSGGDAPNPQDMGSFLEMIQTNSETTEDGIIKKGIIKTVGKYNICNGPYGPFVAYSKGSGRPVSIPNDINPETLTESACLELFNNRKQKPKYKPRT